MTTETSQLDRRDRRARIYGALAVAGSVAGVLAIWLIGDTFGPLVSEEYERYETFNRFMAVFLALQSLGLFAFLAVSRRRLTPLPYVFAWAGVLAWLGMAAGTAVEFWVFTDLPYGADNSRDAAFAFFSVSEFALLLALLALGVSLLPERRAPRWFAFTLIAYPVVDVGLVAGDFSLFLAPSMAGLFIGISVLIGVRAK